MINPVFPLELFRLIVENLSESERTTLHALTLTNRLLNAETNHRLYASMTDPDGTRQYKFLLRIRKSPELAKLVHVYCLPITHNTQRGSLSQLIGRCVPLMVNLKGFTSPSTNRTLNPNPPRPTIGKCSFRLERLTCVDNYFGSKDAEHFLESQPELIHLYWGFNILPVIPQNALPKLRSLGAFARVANVILQEQPITTFHFLIGQETHYDYESKERIFRGRVEEIAALFQHEIPSLRYLSIDCNPTCLLKSFREVEIKFFRNVEMLYMQEAPDEKLLDVCSLL